MSETYFAGIRRWSAVMAIVVPLLFWGAFLLMALGAGLWAVLPFVIGMIAAVSFPLRPRPAAPMAEPTCLRWLPRVATVLIYFWLIRQPEVSSFFLRVRSGRPLCEWPMFAASLILTGTAMCRNWRVVKRLTDEDIYAFFEEKKRK